MKYVFSMTNPATKTVSQTVQNQYEDLPYPYRNPEDEVEKLILSGAEFRDQLNHYCYDGKQQFAGNYRVLLAGGGTGDSLVQWAITLRNNPEAEIVYVDFSTASRKVAEARIAKHDLTHKVKFITDSLLNIGNLELGKFDFINCTGVLHHLENPEAGLKVLSESLKDDGIMMIMVYGEYGRIGVYPMQKIMRYINTGVSDPQEKITNTRAALAGIDSTNNFYTNFASLAGLHIDAEIYDIFLHSQDRAYTVEDVYEFVGSAGLKLVRFNQNDVFETADYYSPEKYIADKNLVEKIKKLPIRQQQLIAEVLNGKMKKHSFYLSKIERKKLELDLDLIPSFLMCIHDNITPAFANEIKKSDGIVNVQFYKSKITFMKTPHLAEIVALIDGKSTLREIFTQVMKKSKSEKCNLQTLLSEFRGLFNVLENNYLIFLRHPSVPAYENFINYQKQKFGHLLKDAAQKP
jgi:SAM-dependent methyltransferase